MDATKQRAQILCREKTHKQWLTQRWMTVHVCECKCVRATHQTGFKKKLPNAKVRKYECAGRAVS